MIALFVGLALTACDFGDSTPPPFTPGPDIGPTPITIATPPSAPISTSVGSGLVFLLNSALVYLDPLHGTGGALVTAQAGRAVRNFALAPTGDKIAYAATGGLPTYSVWMVNTAQPGDYTHLLDLPGGNGYTPEIAFAPDGSHLAVTAWDEQTASGRLATLDLNTPQAQPQILSGVHGEYLYSPTWSPDNRRLVYMQGERAGGVGYDATMLATDAVRPTGVFTVAVGSELPRSRQALPPLDPTWVTSDTVAFAEWNLALGARGTWVANLSTPQIAPRLLVSDQLGLATWSKPVDGARLLAYRVPSDGVYVAGLDGIKRVAQIQGVGSTGAFPPLWSADARYIAFPTTGNQLQFADRLGDGGKPTQAVGTAGKSVLRAAWNAAAANPRLAAISNRTLEIYDPQGARKASLDLPVAGSPQALIWQPGTQASGLLLISFAGAQPGTTFAVVQYDDAAGRLNMVGVWAADDGTPLVWVGPGQ